MGVEGRTNWATVFCPTLICTIINTSLAAKGALTHNLQCRTACKIQNGRERAPKWPTWSGAYTEVCGCSKQLLLNKFFDPSTPSFRRGRDRKTRKTGGAKKEKKKDR